MAQLYGFNPATYYSTTAEFTLGGLYTDQSTGYVYRYIKTADAVAWVDGMVVEAAVNSATAATNAFTGTVDRAGGSSGHRIPLGICVYGLSSGQVSAPGYVFVMVDGYHAAVREAAAAITKGQKFTSAPNPADGDAVAVSAYTDHVVGIALAASTGTFPAKIKVAY